jgi:hypothetical protein
MNIPEQEVEFENLGTTIEVIVNGTTTVAEKDFQLMQFHMHTPSEHHINGEYHPLEVHMVHQGVGKLSTSPPSALLSRSHANTPITSRRNPTCRHIPPVPGLEQLILVDNKVPLILLLCHPISRHESCYPSWY